MQPLLGRPPADISSEAITNLRVMRVPDVAVCCTVLRGFYFFLLNISADYYLYDGDVSVSTKTH